MKHGYAGAEWLKSHVPFWNEQNEAAHKRKRKKTAAPFVPMTVSAFGERVADLLGYVFKGLYHIHNEAQKADWSDEHHISIVTGKSLSTYDFSDLTQLVVLCHDQKIRLEIDGCAPRYLRLHFSSREKREGNMFERHPTLETAVEVIRKNAGSEVLP